MLLNICISAQQKDKKSFQHKAVQYNTTSNNILSNTLYKHWTLFATIVVFATLYKTALNFHDTVAGPVQKHAKLHTTYDDVWLL